MSDDVVISLPVPSEVKKSIAELTQSDFDTMQDYMLVEYAKEARDADTFIGLCFKRGMTPSYTIGGMIHDDMLYEMIGFLEEIKMELLHSVNVSRMLELEDDEDFEEFDG